jgi:DNA-binding MarR family transcriptional regulator
MIRSAEDSVESAARNQGLHPTDFRCLGYLLARGEPVSPSDIIAHLSITSGAGSALLKRLESMGFISRTTNPADKRGILVVLESEAASEPLDLHRQISAEHARALADFSPSEIEAIATYLERVQRLSRALNGALYGPAGKGNTTPANNTLSAPEIIE